MPACTFSLASTDEGLSLDRSKSGKFAFHNNGQKVARLPLAKPSRFAAPKVVLYACKQLIFVNFGQTQPHCGLIVVFRQAHFNY